MRIFLCFVLISVADLSAQDSPKKAKWSIYPIPYWSPQTSFGGGLISSYKFFPRNNDSLPTTITAYGLYTAKKQILVETSFDHWRNVDLDRYTTSLSYRYFPDFFYGIGNDLPDTTEDYTPRSIGVEAVYQHKVRRHLYAGAQAEWLYYDVIKTEPGGKLEQGVAGTGKGSVVSVGLNANYDTRDNRSFPRNGSFHSARLQPYPTFLGSRYGFVNLLMDYRWYFPLFERQAVAYQLVTRFGWGNVPFYKMALFGGNDLMRGYWEGRYRDRNMIAMQAEYRFHLFWKIGGALFGGFGDVAHDVIDFRVRELKPSFGYGLRFELGPQGSTSIRIDLGYGKNSAALAAGIGEAF